MGRFVAWIHDLALAWGTPGLFVVAFLDSSFLPLPELNDVLLVWMVTRNKPLMLLYASSVAAGSLAGCLVLYSIGRRGGERLVKGRLGAEGVGGGTAAPRGCGALAGLGPW